MPPLMMMVSAGIFALDAIDQIVVQRRHFAVFLGRETLKPSLARVNGEAGGTLIGAARDQFAQRHFGVLIVHADPAFDGDGQGDRLAHRRHAVRHQLRLLHQAGAKAARLHPVGRATDIEIDLVIAEAFGDARGFGQLPPVPTRPVAAPRDVRRPQSPTAAHDRHAGSHPPSPFRYRAGRGASGRDAAPGNGCRSSPSWARQRTNELSYSFRYAIPLSPKPTRSYSLLR